MSATRRVHRLGCSVATLYEGRHDLPLDLAEVVASFLGRGVVCQVCAHAPVFGAYDGQVWSCGHNDFCVSCLRRGARTRRCPSCAASGGPRGSPRDSPATALVLGRRTTALLGPAPGVYGPRAHLPGPAYGLWRGTSAPRFRVAALRNAVGELVALIPISPHLASYAMSTLVRNGEMTVGHFGSVTFRSFGCGHPLPGITTGIPGTLIARCRGVSLPVREVLRVAAREVRGRARKANYPRWCMAWGASEAVCTAIMFHHERAVRKFYNREGCSTCAKRYDPESDDDEEGPPQKRGRWAWRS